MLPFWEAGLMGLGWEEVAEEDVESKRGSSKRAVVRDSMRCIASTSGSRASVCGVVTRGNFPKRTTGMPSEAIMMRA